MYPIVGALANDLDRLSHPGSLSVQQRLLLADAADGSLDRFSLVEAAIAAESQPAEPLALSCKRFEHLVSQLATSGDGSHNLTERRARLQRLAEAFRALHEQVLTGMYQSDATSLSHALKTGNYNCVSSTVLLVELCRRHGIRLIPMTSATHVFCRWEDGDFSFDIQPTCPRWFELSDEQRRAASPPGTAAARPVSEVALVGKVFYNFGVHYLEEQRFAEAEQAFRASLLLDSQDASARENLLATWNNWALALTEQGRYPEAMRLLDQARTVDATYPPVRANVVHVTQRWAQALCRENRYEEALRLLEQRRSIDPEAPLFVQGPEIVYQMWRNWFERNGNRQESTRLRRVVGTLNPERDRNGSQPGTVRQGAPIANGLSVEPARSANDYARSKLGLAPGAVVGD